MDKNIKGYVIEVIFLTIFLIFIIPICVSASNDYTNKKETFLNGYNTTIDITKKEGNLKQLNLYSNTNNVIKVKLGLMITKFYNEYLVEIDGNTYDLSTLEYLEDEIYRYYILGTYEIDKEKNIDFEIKVKDKSYYNETLTFSFYTEGIM